MDTTIGMMTQQSAPIVPPVRIRYCLYARKSSESEERQVLSIESQVNEMLRLAEKEGLEIAEIRREAHSAKDSGQRPVFKEIISDIRIGRFNGVLTWAPDRLSRNAGDLGSLVDLMDQKLLIEIRTYGQRFANSPSEKFMLMILCSQAKLENDNKSVNVKRGLKTRCEMGLRPGVAPTGYLNEKRSDRKCHSIVDPERAHVVKQIFEKFVHEHWSGRKIYHWLKFDLKFRTRSNHHLSLSNLYLILQNPFYCGIFEFPVKSGNWYTGKHEPLITKELFDLVRQQLKRNHVVRSEMKEFAFTRLISCGICKSSITAEEKYKKLSNGTTARYVYYGCTRNKDARCGNLYIREEELVKQLVGIIDQLDINEIGLKHKFEKEVEQLKDLQESFFGGSDLVMNRKIDLREYAKHVLRKGGTGEKRELLGCLKSRLVLKDKVLLLNSNKTENF